jgi:hypothetical protein
MKVKGPKWKFGFGEVGKKIQCEVCEGSGRMPASGQLKNHGKT